MKQDITPTWFITGAASGFGLAFAQYALSKGYNVVATARNPDNLQSLVSANPNRVLALQLDVTQKPHIQPAIEAAVNRFQRIDTLINNAGYGVVGAIEETPEQELRAQMETNFFGAVAVTNAVLPVMRQQQQGAIVNISSMAGQVSFAGVGAYSASKFALEGLSEALQQEVAPFGIKVLIVEPGSFRTNFAGSALKRMPQMAIYDATAGLTRKTMENAHHSQAGDPMKAAAAIDLAIQSEKTPLRLQLGDDAVDAVRGHSETLLEEMRTWEVVSRNTRIESLETV